MPEVHLVKAFTQDPEQGNPAGVVLDADDLTADQMLEIAAELGFSESAFVSHSDVADFKVRFFSPKREVPLCGHATIATFYTLFMEGKVDLGDLEFRDVTQEALAGILPVRIHKNGLVMMTQTEPVFYKDVYDTEIIAGLLGLPASDIGDSPIQLVSTGTPKLMIPVKSLEILFAIKPDLEGMYVYSEKSEVRGFYPFTTETQDPTSDFHARQFNPFHLYEEDPLTGMAAGALGAYSVRYKILGDKKSFVVEQGYVLNKGGKIFVEVGEKVQVGGYAVVFGRRKS